MKILIAEDDPVSRKIVSKAVEKFGHECLIAEDGLEAWNIYQETPDLDVVLSDWMMPKLDGLELCQRVRELDRDNYTFFIFLTSLGTNQHLLEGMKAGADEYMIKPLDREQLRAKLISADRVASLHRHLNEDEEQQQDSGDDDADTAVPPEGPAATPPKRKPRRPGKVWDILISQGKLTEDQMQRALKEQQSTPDELGKIMVSLDFISHADLARAQAERLNLDYVEINESDVDPEALHLVPEKMVRRHEVLPLRIQDERLVVAMVDPTDLHALEDLRMVSKRKILPVVATEDEIQRIQTRVLAVGDQVSEMLEEASQETVKETDDVELGADAGGEEAPIIRLVGSVLQRAVSEGASDIHFEPQEQALKVRLRVDGVLREYMSVPSNLQDGVLARLKILSDLDIAEHRIPQDGRFSVRLSGRKVDLRVATLPTVYGEEVVLRLLDTSDLQTDLESLGFDPEVLERYEEVYRKPYGTILVTGPTGSGKSTTLYATLSELNSAERKIITVEDPVEYRMPGINQVQVNPRAGLTFASGLRSILRADPDIVMIGEIRDFETAKTSVEAALTGHLVLSTLHTNDAPSTVNRLTDMGVEPFLTASAVDCVIAQRLARRLCEDCKKPVEIEDSILEDMDFTSDRAPDKLHFHEPAGCKRCGDTGYKGRLGFYEMMIVTEEIREMILRRVSTSEISHSAEANGMVRLREDGLLKAASGLTTIEEVLRTVV